MHISTTIFALITVLFLFGCDTRNQYSKEAVQVIAAPAKNVAKSKVRAAYEQARASMLQEKQVNVDVLWVLHQVVDSDAELEAFIAQSKNSISDPHFLPGVFPDSPRVELPDHPDQGIKKFILYLQAALGRPQDRALLWLKDFIASEEEGYILTHQFLSLIWAEQADLPLTEEMLSRKQELWQRVYEEQRSVDSVDSIDLYMERVAILLKYGHPDDFDQNAVDNWIEQIIDLQLAAGAWPLSKTRITFEGVSTEVSSPRSHTTALAMMALNAYMHMYKG